MAFTFTHWQEKAKRKKKLFSTLSKKINSHLIFRDFCSVEKKIYSDRILAFGIRSIRSPAKVGLVVTELLITSPVVSWRGWETPPAPWLNCHSLLNHG